MARAGVRAGKARQGRAKASGVVGTVRTKARRIKGKAARALGKTQRALGKTQKVLGKTQAKLGLRAK